MSIFTFFVNSWGKILHIFWLEPFFANYYITSLLPFQMLLSKLCRKKNHDLSIGSQVHPSVS